ncbi:hypothetical protein BI347_19150 [Chromobacterium sphagni]|uniref:Uncharacterized protein n=1 Tax=Chromobacterium sphagni TaxID=1903179 RepID=A0A1S1WUS4_9NEIS|nr:hypothetical protein [Chromobacterium sphagni]OHX10647.1 hypothetical protein BI347_19150 [Chromobacterium sphagni]
MKSIIIALISISLSDQIFAQETSNNINPFGSTQMEDRIKDFPKLKVTAEVSTISDIHTACGMTKWIWAIGAFMQGCTSFDQNMQWAHIRIARNAATRDLRHEVKHTCGEYHGDVMPRYVADWKKRVNWQPAADNVCTPEYEVETYRRLSRELKQAGWSPSDEEHERLAQDRLRRGG